MKGCVKWFSKTRGYGFIEKQDKSGDIFVHFTGIKSNPKMLYENDEVEFEIGVGRDGKSQAVNLVKVS